MDVQKSFQFIDKTISKTKNRELNWQLLPSDLIIKPLPSEDAFFNNSIAVKKLTFEGTISEIDSYVADYKSGKLLLLTYQSIIPSTNRSFSLRLQDKKSKYSIEIAHSSDSDDTAVSLMRLYNLIDKDDSSLRSLINDFLNS